MLISSSYWPTQAYKAEVPSLLSSQVKTQGQTQALALGLGSLFNHSRLRQNVGWKRDIPNTCIVYTALRDIQAGEELCISYGRLWFDDADTRSTAGEENGHVNGVEGNDEETALEGLSGISIDIDVDNVDELRTEQQE